MNYNVWKPIYGASKPALPKISKNEGLKIAEDFIKKKYHQSLLIILNM